MTFKEERMAMISELEKLRSKNRELIKEINDQLEKLNNKNFKENKALKAQPPKEKQSKC